MKSYYRPTSPSTAAFEKIILSFPTVHCGQGRSLKIALLYRPPLSLCCVEGSPEKHTV